jgi:hypothetical protein
MMISCVLAIHTRNFHGAVIHGGLERAGRDTVCASPHCVDFFLPTAEQTTSFENNTKE